MTFPRLWAAISWIYQIYYGQKYERQVIIDAQGPQETFVVILDELGSVFDSLSNLKPCKSVISCRDWTLTNGWSSFNGYTWGAPSGRTENNIKL